MNTAEYVKNQIQVIKNSGIPLSEAAWESAKLCVGWPYIFGAKGKECTIAYRKAVSNRGTEAKYQNVKRKCQAIRETNPTGSCIGCKWYPNKKRVLSYDCRGFTYWILYQVFGWKLQGGGCTTQWNNNSNWKAKGYVKDGIPQNVIVCLFYEDEKDKKVMAHTGLYYNGETCECSAGVQYSKALDAKWTRWGIPACVDIVPPEPVPVTKPTIRKGDRGPYVLLCQEDLITLGYDVGRTGADGIFGKNTEAAVRSFQHAHDDTEGHALKVDGVVGKKTWGAIDAALAGKEA